MKMDMCTGSANAEATRMTNGSTESEGQRDYGFMVAAGGLIGLGLGALADHIIVGVLIGVGIGLLVSELLPFVSAARKQGHLQHAGANMKTLALGSFLILVGAGAVLAPAALWVYAIPGFFILLGIGYLVHGFSRHA
jgi:hypothetical protein